MVQLNILVPDEVWRRLRDIAECNRVRGRASVKDAFNELKYGARKRNVDARYGRDVTEAAMAMLEAKRGGGRV
jgi:hypothetical protein